MPRSVRPAISTPSKSPPSKRCAVARPMARCPAAPVLMSVPSMSQRSRRRSDIRSGHAKRNWPGRKLQIPSTKLQRNSKHRSSKLQRDVRFDVLDLVLLWSSPQDESVRLADLDVGAWSFRPCLTPIYRQLSPHARTYFRQSRARQCWADGEHSGSGLGADPAGLEGFFVHRTE